MKKSGKKLSANELKTIITAMDGNGKYRLSPEITPFVCRDQAKFLRTGDGIFLLNLYLYYNDNFFYVQYDFKNMHNESKGLARPSAGLLF